jgi:hypothetical protein
MPKPRLQRSRVMPCFASAYPQECRSMCGWMGNGIFARSPKRTISVWKLFGAIGPPRSVANTCGPAGCSRCRRRKARISSPCIGCTLGVPRLVRRTCRRPAASSTGAIAGRIARRRADHADRPSGYRCVAMAIATCFACRRHQALVFRFSIETDLRLDAGRLRRRRRCARNTCNKIASKYRLTRGSWLSLRQ